MFSLVGTTRWRERQWYRGRRRRCRCGVSVFNSLMACAAVAEDRAVLETKGTILSPVHGTDVVERRPLES